MPNPKMRFVYGLIVGVASGLGLMFAFANISNRRAKRRSELAAIVQAFAKMTLQDSRKIFTAEELPSWVVFQEKQKLNWLNLQLKKIWPYIDEAASELIRSSVEPILDQYRPAIISSLGFSELTLGTVAPQFTGVQIVDGESEEIILELEMEWDGNPSFILAVKTLIGVALPVQVKDMAFAGVFRLIFKPLVDEFPCFGALCYSLRQKKKLDFTLKIIGGDLSAIPGISDSLDETIRDAIEDSISWPVRKIIPILPGDYSNLELKPAGTLEVKLVQAKGLANKDLIGKSDPFAALFVRPIRSRTKNSQTINNELNPFWNENFEFVVEDPSTQHLTVRIFDDEGLLPSEFVGCAHVPIKELEPGRVKAVWLKLVKDLEVHIDNKERGKVHLELLYIPFGMKNELIKDFAHDMLKGVLSVTVKSAEELPNLDFFGKSDPYVVITMKISGAKMETEVIHDDSNPIWNETFDFDVEDALHEMLVVEIYDHDVVGKNFIGRCVMTLTRVLMEGRYSDTFPLDETESGKLLLNLKWTPKPTETNGS